MQQLSGPVTQVVANKNGGKTTIAIKLVTRFQPNKPVVFSGKYDTLVDWKNVDITRKRLTIYALVESLDTADMIVFDDCIYCGFSYKQFKEIFTTVIDHPRFCAGLIRVILTSESYRDVDQDLRPHIDQVLIGRVVHGVTLKKLFVPEYIERLLQIDRSKIWGITKDGQWLSPSIEHDHNIPLVSNL